MCFVCAEFFWPSMLLRLLSDYKNSNENRSRDDIDILVLQNVKLKFGIQRCWQCQKRIQGDFPKGKPAKTNIYPPSQPENGPCRIHLIRKRNAPSGISTKEMSFIAS